MSDFLASWSARVALIMLLPVFLFVPWRRTLLWDTGDGVVVPLKVVQYGLVWNRPFEASLDVTRILTELFLLAVIAVIGSQLEQLRALRR